MFQSQTGNQTPVTFRGACAEVRASCGVCTRDFLLTCSVVNTAGTLWAWKVRKEERITKPQKLGTLSLKLVSCNRSSTKRCSWQRSECESNQRSEILGGLRSMVDDSMK